MKQGLAWALSAVLGLSACASDAPRKRGNGQPAPPASSSRYTMDQDLPPAPDEIPADIDKTPDAVPVEEPLSRSGNPATYEVFGQTYRVMKSREPSYTEQGRASFYGKKFHGHKTASGERYNMFAMTAAHKTLPLPTYVRVTRTDTGKSCIVKVNDRGPFVKGRIIDLSYAAAARLDMIRAGHAPVEMTVITAEEAAQPATEIPPFQPGYWLVGRYRDPIDATALREELRPLLGEVVAIRQNANDAEELLLMAGPYPDNASAEAAREQIRARGLPTEWITGE